MVVCNFFDIYMFILSRTARWCQYLVNSAFFVFLGLPKIGHNRLRLLLLASLFTARCYAWAVLAMDLCLSVCHKSEFYKTAKHRIAHTIPHDSPGNLVFWRQRFPRNHPFRSAKCRWVGQNRRVSTNNRLYVENVKDRHMVSIKVE